MTGGLFFLGSMLGRIMGPAVQDLYEQHTRHGRSMVERRLQKEIEKEERDFERKKQFSQDEYERSLEKMKIELEEKKKNSEAQLLLAYSDCNQKRFIQDCWPLRNPFEVPLGIEPIYAENKSRLESCKLKTVDTDGLSIVPLRVISALKNNEMSYAPTTNGELSMFLMKHYAANSSHAVLSDIGSWKSDAPVNDATINYLFMGLKGQPVVILAPEHTHDGSIIRFKMWGWGLGEKLAYPAGFDLGWIDINALYQRIVAKEVKKFSHSLAQSEISVTNKKLERAKEIIDKLDKHADTLTKDEIDVLINLLPTPEEIGATCRRKTNEVIANTYSCITGMYADAYHLNNYGVAPQLPLILNTLKGIDFFLPTIADFYSTLFQFATEKNILPPEKIFILEWNIIKQLERAKVPIEKQQPFVLQALKNFAYVDSKAIESNEQLREVCTEFQNNKNTQRLFLS